MEQAFNEVKQPDGTWARLGPPSALDVQEGGNHYKRFVIQPVEFITKNNLGFCVGNTIKYMCRYKNKNGLQDLKKARHYIDLLIEMEYGPQQNDKTEKGI